MERRSRFSRSAPLLFTLTAVLCSLSGSLPTGAQETPLNRRLLVAVVGFEFDEAAAKEALAAGADINWKNDASNGETLLIAAIKGFKDAKVVKFLLANGADPNAKDASGRTALSYARQYRIDNNQNGRDTLKLLEKQNGDMGEQPVPNNKPGKGTEKPASRPPARTPAAKPAARTPVARRTGPPTAAEVKRTLEASFTTTYESHFFGVKNKVSFEWLGPIVVGQPERRLQPPRTCYPVKLRVKVTAIDPRDGNTSTVERGTSAVIGGIPKREIFCLFRNGFGEWEFGSYEL